MYVCLSVLSHISKTTCPNFTKFFLHVICGVAVARSSCDEDAISFIVIVDDIMFAHNRRGKDDANRAHNQSDSPVGSAGTKSDI